MCAFGGSFSRLRERGTGRSGVTTIVKNLPRKLVIEKRESLRKLMECESESSTTSRWSIHEEYPRDLLYMWLSVSEVRVPLVASTMALDLNARAPIMTILLVPMVQTTITVWGVAGAPGGQVNMPSVT